MRHIDIHKIADAAKFNGFHALLLLWCAIIIICDGYDLAVAGIAVPSIMKDMGVTAQNAGFMVSSALFGMMFGAIFLGTLADRIGRRWTIVICLALFSVFTAAAGLSHDPYLFSVMRFLAGLGIGGVMPNVVAQMTEYSPRRIRATMVTLMFSGYAVGGIVASTGLGSATVRAKNAFAGIVYNLGFMKLHAGAGDTKLSAAGETDIRNTLLGITVPVPTGTVIASWNRSDLRDLADGVSQQLGIGYTYSISKRTDLYTSASWTRNDRLVALNAYARGASEHEYRAGICHSF